MDMNEFNKIRRKSRKIAVGGLFVGGDAPISVQSMTNTRSDDLEATFRQMRALEEVGCDIVRMTVPDLSSAATIGRLKEAGIRIPIVADIHFDYKLALAAADAGADKIRINPGNIGDDSKIKAVADKCREKNIPIRLGINSGSLEKGVLAKYGAPTAEALAESAMNNIASLERFDFENIIVAIKSSDVWRMAAANKIVSERCDYPIHLGVTEAGGDRMGTVKSAIGIGSSLLSGIGDTMRVSLTADPTLEIKRAREILAALGLDGSSLVSVVSCPTCGRTKVDLIGLAEQFEARMSELHPSKHIKVAIMGCAVNGPGEASDADIGIAGGVDEVLLFKSGRPICKMPQEMAVDRLVDEINKM